MLGSAKISQLKNSPNYAGEGRKATLFKMGLFRATQRSSTNDLK